MVAPVRWWWALVAGLLAAQATLVCCGPPGPEAMRAAMVARREEGGSGLVRLGMAELEELVAPPGRPYDVVLLAQAGQAGVQAMGSVISMRMRDLMEEMRARPTEEGMEMLQMLERDQDYLRHVPKIMRKQREEFALAAVSYNEGLGAGRDGLFFVEMPEDPEHFRGVAARLGLTQAIEVVHLPAGSGLRSAREQRVQLSEHPETPWTAETLADWLAGRTGRRVPVLRWNLFRQWWFPLVLAAAGLSALYAGLWLAVSGHAGRPLVLGAAVLGLWAFSTSGTIYVWLKKMPLVALAPRGHARAGDWVVLLDHPHMQFGLEGWLASAAFMAVSAGLLFITLAVPRMPKGVGSLAGHATVLLLGFVAVGLYDAFTIKLGGTGIRAYVDLPGTGLLRSLFGLLHVEEEVDALAGAGGFH